MLHGYRIKSSSGFTIIEMLVAMAIAGIFFGIFVGVVMATFQTLRTGDERSVAQQNARVAMRFIVQDIKQAIEIAPRRLDEPYDPVDGGLPRDEFAEDNFDPALLAYPLYRRTTDGDYDASDDSPGYIDLYFAGSGGDGDEYGFFRTDGAPYDIRPLAPNRLELLLNTDSFYSHTEYWGDDPETLIPPPEPFEMDLDNSGAADNPQALRTRVTYEHQIAPPRVQLYLEEYEGLEKKFRLPVNRRNSPGVAVDEEFCVMRSIQTELFFDEPNTYMIVESVPESRLKVDSYVFRQPLADHIIDVRFRYWHVAPNSGFITANTSMIEIRYDPDIDHAVGDPNGGGGDPIDTDDGYYRYFTIRGQEIFVWYNYTESSMVEFVDPGLPDPFSPIPDYSFIMRYRDDLPPGNEEYDRGILLFEGWRFINMVSVTIRATNRENLNKFKSTIDYLNETGVALDDRRDYPDYKMGFIDFGRGTGAAATGIQDRDNPNVFDPFYRAIDSHRFDTLVINGSYVFDLVEPNINPNYDPNSFVTLEVFVVPPIVKAIAEQSERLLWYGFSFK